MNDPERSKITLRRIDISGSVPPDIQRDLIRQQYVVSMAAMTLGAIAIVCGAALTWLGLEGTIQWSFSAFGVKSKLADAGPGALLFVVGVLIIALNRFSVRIRK